MSAPSLPVNPERTEAHEVIRVIGARENNLKGVTLDIPKRRLTVFTGVSGSGKSSLVFDTIAAESQRLINQTYPAFLQGFMPELNRPEVDRLECLTAAITVSQERLAPNVRSTVGTVTDANSMLRVLFSQLGEPRIGSPQAFSFNVPSVTGQGMVRVSRGAAPRAEKRTYTLIGGMCPRCEGTGSVSELSLDELYDAKLSLNQDPFKVPGYSMEGWYGRIFIGSGYFDPDKPIGQFSKKELHDLLYKQATRIKVDGINLTYEGLIPRITKAMLTKDPQALQPHIRAFVERAVTFGVCPECAGTRLAAPARSSLIAGINIADACAMQVSDLVDWVRGIKQPGLTALVDALAHLLDGFVEIGLGYLSLDRPSGTLSGGEAQRVRMIRHLGSALTDVTYVFDEPTIGLHPHDIQQMNRLLVRLRDIGNTVLVIEHEPEMIRAADHVIDLGPGAGAQGGEVVYQGDVAGLPDSGTITGQHLADRVGLKETTREPVDWIKVRGATTNNLREVDVDVPLGVLVAITGVAGSGKTSLVEGSLAGRDGVVMIDQSEIKGSRRSSTATWTGLAEPIRKAFAKANGVKPALFSANSEGGCPACGGAGMIYTELGFAQTVTSRCQECDGRGFAADVLEFTLAGRNISEVMAMPVGEALEFFAEGEARVPAARTILSRLVDVGLGYLQIGQPLTTLSGGERQRLKLAAELAAQGHTYLLDEPTAGLHPADVARLLDLLDRLVAAGKSVLVVEHNLAVIAHADWIIDLGPGAGHDGGKVVFAGTPAGLAASRGTLTGRHLAEYLSR